MSRRASEHLARTFAVIASCAGVMASTLDRARHLELSSVGLAIAAAALTGWLLGAMRSLHHAAIVCTIAGWLATFGIVPLWFATDRTRGAVCSFVLLPAAMIGLALVGRRVGRATPDSVLDRSSRRSLVACAGAVVTLVAWATLVAGTNEAFVALLVGVGAWLTTLFVLAVDVRAALLVRNATSTSDFGAGERRVERREEVPASYRTTAVVVRVEHTARSHALRWVARVIAIELVAAAVASAGFALQSHAALRIEPPRPHVTGQLEPCAKRHAR